MRRRYLNMEIAQVSPKYVYDLASYKKSLEQRNRLLRDLRERPIRESGLDAGECYRRTRTVIPQQALALTNSELVHEVSTKLTAALWAGL